MNPAEFANIAETEDRFWWYRGMRSILYSLVDPIVKTRKIQTVLEAGCGTGYNAVSLQQRYGWRVYPLDLQMEGLAYGKKLGAVRLVQGNLAALPFCSGTFDAVVCLDVIVHFARGDESRALAEISRVLAPGGLLILRVSALDRCRSRHSEFTGERQRFTAGRLTAAVRQQGIRVVRRTYANSLLLPVALLKFRAWEPILKRPPESGVRPVSPWLDRILAAPLATESRWVAAGLNFPLGQSLVLIGEKEA